ncbi:class I SAM-dependent methyltransferase [Marinoscillum pacificum]|uniref:class I SAM-dependent methyltransferase n=1 Tax=Marinoscillum pacificum TaxID=392723 RepID=UPI002157523B|nr:class I SAM-dependent methyltransferase [Marinoscillum pacificum]
MKQLISFLLRRVPRKYLQLVSHYGLRVAALFYKGNNVQCPVCDSTFRKFLPYGRQSRENALCPSCLALERHRLIWLYLRDRTDFFTKERKMLHIAPELCFIDRFEKLDNLDYITGDIESPLAKVKMDIHEIPFEENTFDVIFCNHVLEHVDSDIKAMQEMRRVLKPGGWAILQVPFFYPLEDETFEDKSITSPTEREKVFGQDDHVRMYGKDYAKRLASAGFKVVEEKMVMELPKEEVKRYALPQDEIIYRVEK